MINLHLAIYDREIEVIKFFTIQELVEYLKGLEKYDCIWLAAEDGGGEEVLITENLTTLINAVINSHFTLLWESPKDLYLQEYQTFEDAYAVALGMRETNPKCYN